MPSRLVEAVVRRTLLRRLLRPLVAFVAVVAAGVAGFGALASVGAVDALFWLLDPTSIELHFREHEGPETLVKAYALIVLSGLVVAGLWTGETVFSAAFGGRIREELEHMRTEQRIEELDRHVIVCGYGTFGGTVASRLSENGREVVVVERRTEGFERALADGLLAVEGDARRGEVLADAGVERATTVVAAIDDTSANVQIAVASSNLVPTVRLVVRAGDEMDEALARRVGADEVVVPEVVSAEHVSADI
ncbi:potassium channel family protein [Halorarum salinum]|uniref:potassium channel family protein n=1 Tax=Halorarum salinum TaxID=2743089 RepID=UPI00374437D6